MARPRNVASIPGSMVLGVDMSDFRKKAPTIRDTNSQFERESKKIAQNFNSQPMSSGVMLKNVSIGTATTQIAHRLGRPFVGFTVIDASVGAHVSRDTSVITQFDQYISLKASAAGVFSLWVF